ARPRRRGPGRLPRGVPRGLRGRLHDRGRRAVAAVARMPPGGLRLGARHAGRPAVTPLRVAVVGCGDIAAVHLDAILDAAGAELVGVCDVHDERRAAASGLGNCPGFADLTAMLDAVAPDVVHVCTPHHRHADLAAQCLARGVSVLVEKPVAHTVADGERLASVAEDSSAVLGVCFQNRYNDTARKLRNCSTAANWAGSWEPAL